MIFFQIQQDSTQLQEICINCKTKLIDFFIFKRRNEEARKIFSDSESGGVKNMLLEVIDQIDNSFEEPPDDTAADCDEIPEEEIKEEFCDETETVQDQIDDEMNLTEEEVKGVEIEEEMEQETMDDYNEDSQVFLEEFDDSETTQTTTTVAETSRTKSNRQANPETWIRNRRKLAKNTGQSYFASNGKLVDAKEMKCSCSQTCRMQCTKKIDEENRLRNFKYFYSLGDIAKQRKFLFDRMKTYEPKRTKIPKNPQKFRAVQRCYFLDLTHENGAMEMLQVCKFMFLNTFAISSQMIDTLYRKAVNEGRFSDTRGKFERKR
jgi:hypothetical protein